MAGCADSGHISCSAAGSGAGQGLGQSHNIEQGRGQVDTQPRPRAHCHCMLPLSVIYTFDSYYIIRVREISHHTIHIIIHTRIHGSYVCKTLLFLYIRFSRPIHAR